MATTNSMKRQCIHKRTPLGKGFHTKNWSTVTMMNYIKKSKPDQKGETMWIRWTVA